MAAAPPLGPSLGRDGGCFTFTDPPPEPPYPTGPMDAVPMEAVTEMRTIAVLEPLDAPTVPDAADAQAAAPGSPGAPADVLDCYPTGCLGCPNRTPAGGCRLMDLLAINDIVTLNLGAGAAGPVHPNRAAAVHA